MVFNQKLSFNQGPLRAFNDSWATAGGEDQISERGDEAACFGFQIVFRENFPNFVESDFTLYYFCKRAGRGEVQSVSI